MTAFRDILVYSAPGWDEQALLTRACALAKDSGARLTILAVVKDRPDSPALSAVGIEVEALQASVMDEARLRLEPMVEQARGEGVESNAKVVMGIPFVAVIHEVLREGHDLVMLAPDGRPRFIEKWFGSTAMHLLRKCPCPVWVVRPDDAGRSRRVLAAVDTTDLPWEDVKRSINPSILELAGSISRMDASDLHVVQVWSVPFEGYLEVRGGMDDQALRRLGEQTEQKYRRRLSRLSQEVELGGAGELHVHLKRSEDAAAEIVKFVDEEQVDLLVMGTVCRTGVAGFFIGNTAEEVLSAVDCSVLTVKPAGFVSPVTLEEHRPF